MLSLDLSGTRLLAGEEVFPGADDGRCPAPAPGLGSRAGRAGVRGGEVG